jgi:hypothetical protein
MNYADHETTSFPLAVWLIAHDVLPIDVRKLNDGTPRCEFVFDAAEVEEHKAGYRRAVRLLTPKDRPQPTVVPRSSTNVRPADQS